MHLEDTELRETLLPQKTNARAISRIRGTWDKASLVAQTAENLPAMRETQVQSLGQGESLEKEMAACSSILGGEFHGQQSLVGSQRAGHD